MLILRRVDADWPPCWAWSWCGCSFSAIARLSAGPATSEGKAPLLTLVFRCKFQRYQKI